MRYAIGFAVCLAVVVSIGSGAFAAEIHWREGAGGIYTDVTCDDTFTEHWNTTKFGSNGQLKVGAAQDGTQRFTLIGWKDLFTSVPVTSGAYPIVIDNALLTLYGDASTNVTGSAVIVRMTSQWLLTAAGTNESNVHYGELDDTNDVPWASGNLSTSDWTTDDEVTFSFTGQGWQDVYVVDITALMQSLYDNGVNAGFGIHGFTTNATNPMDFDSSESGTSTKRPALDMIYHYEIPEPGTLLLLGTGVLGALGYIRRRRMS